MSGGAGVPAGVERIVRAIPHRYPMLLVDRVTSIVPGESVVATKAVTVNEPWYRSVPAGAPAAAYAYPPALLIESWCQASALLPAWDAPVGVDDGTLALFGGMSDLVFHGAVYPGDVLEHHARVDRSFGDTWIFEGRTLVAGRTVLTVGRVMMACRPAEALARTDGGAAR